MSVEQECYAVIFSGTKSDDTEGYDAMAEEMVALAMQQPGFLDVEHVSMGNSSITISYWESEAAIQGWRENERHRVAQQRGRNGWYSDYSIKIAKVIRHYGLGSK